MNKMRGKERRRKMDRKADEGLEGPRWRTTTAPLWGSSGCGWVESVRLRRRASVPRDTGSAVGKPRDPSASIVTYLLPTQTSAWTGARVPARRSAKTLLSVLALLFFFSPPTSLSFSPSPPSPDSLLFSPLLSRLLLLIFFSPHPSATASRRGHLFDTSPPPLPSSPGGSGVSFFFPLPEEIWRSRFLSSLFFINLIRDWSWEGKIWQHGRILLFHFFSFAQLHTTKGDHTPTPTPTVSASEHMGLSHVLPHVLPSSPSSSSSSSSSSLAALTSEPKRPVKGLSDGLPALVLLIDAMSDYTFTPGGTGGC